MNWKKKINGLPVLKELPKQLTYYETIEKKVLEIYHNDALMSKIDRISVGAKLICIKNTSLQGSFYNNFREYAESITKQKYRYNEGDIYQVSSVSNERIYLFNTSNTKVYTDGFTFFKEENYIFDIFALENEVIASNREIQIDTILED